MNKRPDLQEAAKAVLAENDQGDYTAPAHGMYPHLWLWDSCFIAIGLRHIDIDRAKTEVLSLLSGQWSNGMVPNMIISPEYKLDQEAWRSWANHHSPHRIATSGITQPPMIAEAVVQIGQKLPSSERRLWYKRVFSNLLAYHQWLYRERDPHQEGLIQQIHPWETGLDNTPPWIEVLHKHALPGWLSAASKLRLERLINRFRRDTKYVPLDQRIDAVDAIVFFLLQRRLRRKRYEAEKIFKHPLLCVEDLTFNCIFIRANQHLQKIADVIQQAVPEDLRRAMARTESALSALWDPYADEYYSRNPLTHQLIKQSSIAALMPLYAGCISEERVITLVKKLEDGRRFGPAYPVPSVPLNSPWFKNKNYWQGPVWLNTNWLIIDGLKRAGYKDHAAALKESTIELVEKSGFYEYFDPVTGEPAGAKNFSWTAALTIDLLKAKT